MKLLCGDVHLQVRLTLRSEIGAWRNACQMVCGGQSGIYGKDALLDDGIRDRIIAVSSPRSCTASQSIA